MKKIYIHIGTHKTGSSAIQKWLTLNSKQLLKKHNLMFIPRSKFIEFKNSVKRTEGIDKEVVELGKRIFSKLISTDKYNYMISDEGLCGKTGLGYSNSISIAENLNEVFGSFGLDIHIVVYIRRQDTFFESFYSSYTRHEIQDELYDFKNFYEKFGNAEYDWYRMISDYVKVFGKKRITVKVYDKLYLKDKESIYYDFGKVIGLSSEEISASEFPPRLDINVGLERSAFKFYDLSMEMLSKQDSRLLKKILHQSNPKDSFGSYDFFSVSERRNFLSRFAESNQRILVEFISDPKGRLFSEIEFTDNNGDNPALTIDDLVKVIAGVTICNEKRLKKLESVTAFLNPISKLMSKFK